MKQPIISISLVLFFLSACGNGVVADPITVTASPDNTPWVTYTPSPYPELNSSAIAMTQTLVQMERKLPLCTFPLAGITTEESVTENYTFSEPRVVLAGSNKYFEIREWLPDSNRALIVERVVINGYEQYQSIQLFNPRTIKVQVYAQRDRLSEKPPLWVEGLQSVIYPERQIVSWFPDENGNEYVPSTLIERQLLWLSNGNPDRTQKLRDVEFHPFIAPHEEIVLSLAVKSDGSRVVSLKGDGMQLLQIYQQEVKQGSLEMEQQVPFNAPLSNDSDEPGLLNEFTTMTWQPSTSNVFFYNYISATDPAFILDMDTGQACGLEFGGWVYEARWSPNGRYLAVIKSVGPGVPLWQVYDMSVLDTATGKLYPLEVTKLNPPVGTPCCTDVIGDFAWSPDNHHLAVIGSAVSFGTSPPPPRTFLYLVDFLSGKVDSLFSSTQFNSNFFGTSLAWSPDGSKILALCPELCLINVQKNNQ
jgi:hypothetical protein